MSGGPGPGIRFAFAGRWFPLAGTPSRCSYLWCTLRLSTGHVCMHCYDICESSDSLSLRFVTVCSRHRVGLEGEGEGEVGHPRRRFGIRGTRTFVSLARPGVRACVRACVVPLPPAPQPDEDAFFQEGRRERRIKDPPESALPPGPGNTASELGSGDHSKARSKFGPGGSGFRAGQ